MRKVRSFVFGWFVLVLPALAAGCDSGSASPAPPPQVPQQQPPRQSPYPYPPTYPPAPVPSQPTTQRPLLPPLVGMAAWQAELRSVLSELVAALPAQKQSMVRGIPLVFDPTNEINAFAGCEKGASFLAATAGMLEAVDAIAQTKATDELFGTQTYEAYCAAVLPRIVSSDASARAALPMGIIPANLGGDPRRWSRAHELFDEVLAFTFGHELAHHYLGHTGCANGQGSARLDPTQPFRIATAVVPVFNQVAESAADSEGAFNALDAGRARRPNYEWTENGGTTLLDYFARLERAAASGGPVNLFNLALTNLLRTHPNPGLRVVPLLTAARIWHMQHP